MDQAMRKPALSNWGVFGDDDECGTVNYLTEEVVLRGSQEIIRGERFTLNLPLDQPTPRVLPRPYGRPELTKTAHVLDRERHGFVVNDDYVLLATQGSSQWDAFIHYGVVEDGVDGVFYNGVPRDAVDEAGFAHRNSIAALAERGIVGRGVLVDIHGVVSGRTQAADGDGRL
jgi:hypothetical protein